MPHRHQILKGKRQLIDKKPLVKYTEIHRERRTAT